MIREVHRDTSDKLELFLKKYERELVFVNGFELTFLTTHKKVFEFLEKELGEKGFTIKEAGKNAVQCLKKGETKISREDILLCLNEYDEDDEYAIVSTGYSSMDTVTLYFFISISVESSDNSDDSDYE